MYMGKDKYENEDLIKYGLPEDIWFHVDDMSSAHVYLRLNKDQRLEDVPESAIMECAQLVKANSIEGCKMKEVKIIYTRWRNLHKAKNMETGAIGFHNKSNVKSMRIEKDNSTVKQINKTKEILFPDLAELQESRAAVFRAENKAEKQRKAASEKEDRRQKEESARLKRYTDVMTEDNMMSNAEANATIDDSSARDFEDDFM